MGNTLKNKYFKEILSLQQSQIKANNEGTREVTPILRCQNSQVELNLIVRYHKKGK